MYLLPTVAILLFIAISAFAQALGTAGSVSGTVNDPNNAVVAGATVTLSNALTGYSRTATSDSAGNYRFNDVPQNTYALKVSANGFGTSTQTVNVRSTVPLSVPVSLALGNATATVDIQGSATIVENVPSTHVDVDGSE